MSPAKKFVRNIGSTWCGMIVNIAIVLFLTPYLLEQLGAEAYAIWALVISITGYYGLLDIGLRAGLSQYLSRYLATKDFENFNSIASTGFALLCICAVLILPITLVLAFTSTLLFNIPQEMAFDTGICIITTGLTLGCQLAVFPYMAVFSATERFDLSSLIFVIGRIIYSAITFVVLYLGFGLVALCIVVNATNLLEYAIRVLVARHLVPQMRVSFKRASKKSLSEILSFGGWVAVNNFCTTVYQYSDPIVIAMMLPIGALAPYAVSLRTSEFFEKIMTPIGRVFFPAAVRADASHDTALMKQMFFAGSRFTMLVAACCFVVSMLNSFAFFDLWMGHIESVESTNEIAIIYGILAAAVLFRSICRITAQLIMGQRRAKILAYIGLAEVAINLITSVVLAFFFGVMGVAMGTLVSVVVLRMWLLPLMFARSIDIKLGEFVWNACLAPAVTMILVALLAGAINWVLPVDSWHLLAVRAVLQGMTTLAIVYFAGLTGGEREQANHYIKVALSKYVLRNSVQSQ